MSKDELLREVWQGAFVEEHNLPQHISSLRRVLAEGGDGPIIETVPKRGVSVYRARDRGGRSACRGAAGLP